MTHKAFVHLFILSLWAPPVLAQSVGRAPKGYDPATETSIAGTILQVVSAAAPDGSVGVHITVKTTAGATVKVHLAPAMFIGMNNFFFMADDTVAVRGAYVSHDDEVALWARQVTKGSETLTLRSEDGTPRWPFATAEDPDGCGIPHAPIRY